MLGDAIHAEPLEVLDRCRQSTSAGDVRVPASNLCGSTFHVVRSSRTYSIMSRRSDTASCARGARADRQPSDPMGEHL